MIVTDANLWVALYDDRDAMHTASVSFFERVLPRRIPMFAPDILPLEVGCSIARRCRNAKVGWDVGAKLVTQPMLSLLPLNADFMSLALRAGTECFLRAADSLYAACAKKASCQLVTWDGNLLERAKAITPSAWLAANP